MFYYPAVLKRHTGCFSTIWLVATKGIRVPRRDFLKVNVKSTCEDIMNYVLEQVPPPLPSLPRPRFSLYLSSQLQYGVVLVFHRQCVIFLEELQSVVGQLLKQRKSQNIDMDEPGRLTLDFPDALSLLEETEGALDPLFGVMHMQEDISSPTALIQMSREFLRGASPEHPEQTSPPPPSLSDAALISGITASPETITLREMEPVTIPIAEFEGEDLLDQHPATIDLLLSQTDHFPEGDVEVTPTEQEREIERGEKDADLEGEGAKEPTGSTIELQPTATLSGEDAMLLPQEESAEKLKPPSDQVTPVSVPPVPSPQPAGRGHDRTSLELEDVPQARVKRKRAGKRQLIFFDPETQIPQEELQRQIDDPRTQIRADQGMVVLNKTLSAAELFSKPCTSLPAEVQFLWQRAATISPVSGSDLQIGERGPESTDSEKERQQEMVEEERPELRPREVPRDVAEAEMFDISAHEPLPLEGSDQSDKSREVSPMITSDREGSFKDPVFSLFKSYTPFSVFKSLLCAMECFCALDKKTPVSRSGSALRYIPEVSADVLLRAPMSPWLLPDQAPVLFQSLLPPEVDRRTVSNIFQRLLESLSAMKVCAEQKEPYGDIWISPGLNYGEALLNM